MTEPRVDRALIERVREEAKYGAEHNVPDEAFVSGRDLFALCALAEDVLDGREALERLEREGRLLANYLHAPTREYHDRHAPYRDAAALDAILSHVTPEEP